MRQGILISLFCPILAAIAAPSAKASCRPFPYPAVASDPTNTRLPSANQNLRQMLNQLKSGLELRRRLLPIPLRYELEEVLKQGTHLSKSALHCILSYMQQDQDQDGVPDWTPVIDGELSTILFPFDEDLDGDQIPNFQDLELYRPNPKPGTQTFPWHLRARDAEAAYWQMLLFRQYDIIAWGHSDQHHPRVLATLAHLLAGCVKLGLNLNSFLQFRYFIAVDPADNPEVWAATYPQIKSIAFVGYRYFQAKAPGPEETFEIFSTLAHELGHALAFTRLKSIDLADFVAQYHGLRLPALSQGLFQASLMAPLLDARPSEDGISERVSVHEWFAEAFAHALLRNLHEHELMPPMSPLRDNRGYSADLIDLDLQGKRDLELMAWAGKDG